MVRELFKYFCLNFKKLCHCCRRAGGAPLRCDNLALHTALIFSKPQNLIDLFASVVRSLYFG